MTQSTSIRPLLLLSVLLCFQGTRIVSAADSSQSALEAAAAKQPRPNIIFFYADDLGYGDFACYGSEAAQTPRLDRLAGEGARFTQFCVPKRGD